MSHLVDLSAQEARDLTLDAVNYVIVDIIRDMCKEVRNACGNRRYLVPISMDHEFDARNSRIVDEAVRAAFEPRGYKVSCQYNNCLILKWVVISWKKEKEDSDDSGSSGSDGKTKEINEEN